MSDQYIGQIMMFAGGFTPFSWARCDGHLLSIPGYTSLYSLLGTIYGGDGRSTFALPDLRGRIPMHQGHGPGLSVRTIGQRDGSNTTTLTLSQIPNHDHQLFASTARASAISPSGGVTASLLNAPGNAFYKDLSLPLREMAGGAVVYAGTGLPHENMMPYQSLSFVMALVGYYPSRA